MALILSSEKSHFIQKTVETFSQNKLGQYSKYLDTTPTFVTYYAINQAQSRADIGSGQVNELLGKGSPLRYNKILEFPVYKMQQLIPNGNFEDGNYDVEIELTDLTILPNTVKPRGDDFILLETPNAPKMLFRVTNFKMNTIQSNDFYMIDADLFITGDDCNRIESQVVETYKTVFENIGTQNNCFITIDIYSKAQVILETLNTLTALYHGLYYYEKFNVYAFIDYIYNDTSYNNPDPEWDRFSYIFTGHAIKNANRRPPSTDITYYDIYLAKFIMDSGVFFNADDNSSTSIVTFDDFEPTRFDYLFRQTLWNTIITKDTTLLARYAYYFNHNIEKYVSVVKNNFPNSMGNTVVIRPNMEGNYYFDKYLIDMILDGKPENKQKSSTQADIDIVNIAKILQDDKEGLVTDHIDINPYDIEIPCKESDDIGIDPDLLYIFDIIYNYINNISSDIDGSRIIKYFNTPSQWNYRYHIIIIYILKALYNSYFNSTENQFNIKK